MRKKEADKADGTELICVSIKMNYVISMYVVPVNVQSKIPNGEVRTGYA